MGHHLLRGQAARLPLNPLLHSSTPPPVDPLCLPSSAKHRSRAGSTHPSSTHHRCTGTSRLECRALLVLDSPGRCLQVCTAVIAFVFPADEPCKTAYMRRSMRNYTTVLPIRQSDVTSAAVQCSHQLIPKALHTCLVSLCCNLSLEQAGV